MEKSIAEDGSRPRILAGQASFVRYAMKRRSRGTNARRDESQFSLDPFMPIHPHFTGLFHWTGNSLHVLYIYIIRLEEDGAAEGKLEGCLRGSSTTSFRENIESRYWCRDSMSEKLISGFFFFFNWNAYVSNKFWMVKKNSFFRSYEPIVIDKSWPFRIRLFRVHAATVVG